jgi:hypothetical protein
MVVFSIIELDHLTKIISIALIWMATFNLSATLLLGGNQCLTATRLE